MRDNRIKHIVVLMMENRSFDHLLGFLTRENDEIRGIVAAGFSNPQSVGPDVPVSDGAKYQGQLSDPGHEFGDVHLQLYGTPAGAPFGDPDMSGFVKSYEEKVGKGRGGDVMRCFTPDQLPVLSALARSYVVCDAWFSSVPGPTLPNRAFAHFGTSFGRLDMSPDYFRAQPSVYQRLKQRGRSGKIYYYDRSSGTQGLTFLVSDQSQYFGTLGDFKRDCKKNKLPDYSFIEPNYNDHDSQLACDQHPDNHMLAGDNFIREIYEAIRQSDAVWKSTVFVVTWDEHGGLYDHVVPPIVSHRDGFTSVSPAFDFDRLGVRVPAVVISPYVVAGTVDHTPYEHASIPATVTDQFIGDPQVSSPFAREKWAATFLHLLQDQAPRSDWPDFAAAPAVQNTIVAPNTMAVATGLGATGANAAPLRSNGARELSDLLKSQVKEARAELASNRPRAAAALRSMLVDTHEQAAAFLKAAFAALVPEPVAPANRRSPKGPAKTATRKTVGTPTAARLTKPGANPRKSGSSTRHATGNKRPSTARTRAGESSRPAASRRGTKAVNRPPTAARRATSSRKKAGRTRR